MRVRLKLDRLHELLAESSLSQNAWAMRIGISRGHWSDLVNGKHLHPSARTRRQILDAFDVPREELFEIEVGPDGSDAGILAGLGERYVFDREIGEGAMGTVHLARDRRLGRRVAIKVVAEEATGTLDAARFLKEVRRMARLQHPHVLPLLDAGESDGRPYYVTPYVDGGSLRELLELRGTLPLDEAVRLIGEIGAALEHAHRQRVLHCDVKPENVLLSDGHAMVADFGLSRAVHLEAVREWDRPPEVDTGAGTPAYVSPEQARAEVDLDARSDVYSLACVLFEMLAGRPPFTGRTTSEVVRRRFDAVPPDLRRLAPRVPEGVAAVVGEAMSVDPVVRPASPAAFVERLELARSAAGAVARPADGEADDGAPLELGDSPDPATLTRSTAALIAGWAVAATRPRRRGLLMESLIEDLRFSWRSLRRRPLVATVAVVTLALGIGVNAAMFSVINAVVLSPLPYPEPDRLVRLYSTFEGSLCCVVSAPNFLDMRERLDGGFERVAAYTPATYTVTGEGEPLRLSGYRVSDGLFEVLGAAPRVGRLIEPDDDRAGAEPVAVLSDGLWRDRYGADPEVVGETIVLNSVSHTIVGVAPPGFRVTGRPEIFAPFAWEPESMPSRGANFLFVIGRLEDGATMESAMDRLGAIYQDLVDEYPGQIVNKGVGARTLDDWLIGSSRREPLLVLWGAVAMVLLIACVNVVNLMLARAETRQRELSVRAALGAGRGRLMRHFLTESLLVALVGAGLGLLGAYFGLRALLAAFGDAVPRSDSVSIDPAVLLFALVVALVTGVVVGLVPALQAHPDRLQAALREGGRGSAGGQTRLRQGLVVLEVGAAVVLVIGAGLLLKSFWRLSGVDLGIEPERVLTARVSLPQAHYPGQVEILGFFRSLRDEVARLPDVEAAGLVTSVPFSGQNSNYSRIVPLANPELESSFVETRGVSPGFFASIGIELQTGRNFRGSDDADAPPVVIINQRLADQLFPEGSPLGQRIGPSPTAQGWEVIGVVGEFREFGPDRDVAPTFYYPITAAASSTMSLTIRSRDDPLDLVPDLRRIVGQLDPDLPIFQVSRLDQLVADRLGDERFRLSLLGLFAVLALALGAVGTYGVMAYTVEQRTREIGLRQALGATPGDVLGLVVGRGALLAAVGIVAGLVGAYFLRGYLESLLYEVSTLDPVVHLGVAALLAAVAVAACAIPARRAAGVDPMVALRGE